MPLGVKKKKKRKKDVRDGGDSRVGEVTQESVFVLGRGSWDIFRPGCFSDTLTGIEQLCGTGVGRITVLK